MCLSCLWLVSGRADGLAETLAKLVQASSDAAVNDVVTNLSDHTTQDCRVDDDPDLDVPAGSGIDGRGQPISLFGGQVDRRSDGGHGLVPGCGAALHQCVDDGGQISGATGTDHHRDEGRRSGRGLPPQQVLYDLLTAGDRNTLIGQGRTELIVGPEGLGEPEQFVLNRGEVALGAAERVVQSSLDAEVQGRLIDAYIDEVAGGNG